MWNYIIVTLKLLVAMVLGLGFLATVIAAIYYYYADKLIAGAIKSSLAKLRRIRASRSNKRS